jgi:hypothetical protein
MAYFNIDKEVLVHVDRYGEANLELILVIAGLICFPSLFYHIMDSILEIDDS